ncbi:MAG: hypothetical protein JO344_04390 [Planctomycetaceae bacterium]|nr:hypothetical protein [Planctomycetaceae bacterium]
MHVDVFKEDPDWSVEEFVIAKPALADDSPPTRWRGGFEERHTRLAVIRYVGPSDHRPKLLEHT